MRLPRLVVSLVLILVGGLLLLQGLGVIGGSFMSGSTLWAVWGAVILIFGIVIFVTGLGGSSTET